MDIEKEIICSEIRNLSKDEKIRILAIIKSFDKSKIQRFKDGSRINLDLLPNELIERIYLKVKYFLGEGE